MEKKCGCGGNCGNNCHCKSLEKTILYVDDTEENIEASKKFFSDIDNYVIETYKTKKDALEAIKSGKNYYLALFDLDMSKTDGDKKTGEDLLKNAVDEGIFSYILTQEDDKGGHGIQSYLRLLGKNGLEIMISGQKSEVKTWQTIYNELQEWDGSHEAVQRFKENCGESKTIMKNLYETLGGE